MFKKARYVLSVYREGSFTKAAKALYISQPCLSTAIKQIEAELGARIFERGGGALHPTHIGFAYIKTAEEIVALEDAFAAKMSAFNSLSAGELRVGGSNYVCSYILPHIIDRFSDHYPHITVELTEGSSFELLELLKKGEIDAIVDSFDHAPDGYVYVPLLKEKILLAVPKSASCNQTVKKYATTATEIYCGSCRGDALTELSIAHFKDEKFILLKPGNSMHEHATRIFRESGVTPQIGLYLDQLSTSYFLCAQGGGCAFVSDTIFKYHKFDDPILLYNVCKDCSRTFGIAYKQTTPISNAVKSFVQVAKTTCKSKKDTERQ